MSRTIERFVAKPTMTTRIVMASTSARASLAVLTSVVDAVAAVPLMVLV